MQVDARGSQEVVLARTGTNKKCGWLAAILLAAALLPTAEAEARQDPASIVIDANTGATLHASAPDAYRYPASLTKMMTIYLVFERLKDGRLKPNSQIRFSANAAAQQPSKLGLNAGETITVTNAVKALITKSANDVAVAVAEHIAGSEPAFAKLMTAKARQLGMSRTVFRNASGLPDSKQVTTARDMARLGLALQRQFPRRYAMFSRRVFTYNGRRYKNHNRLLGRFAGTDGIKTGYTRASGFNVTTSVRRGSKHVVGVVMGRRTGRVRDQVMRNLLVKALPKASNRRRIKRKRTEPLVARPRLLRRPRPVAQPRLAERSLAPRPLARPAPRRVARPKPFLGKPYSRSNRRPAPTHRATRPTLRQQPRVAQELPRVRQPSTLNAQAARLPRRVAPRPHIPVVKAKAARGQPVNIASTHQVQVGAFFSKSEAQRALLQVQQRAGALLRGFHPVSVEVPSEARTIYRARFAGFDANSAASVCAQLKTVRVDCFVARAN